MSQTLELTFAGGGSLSVDVEEGGAASSAERGLGDVVERVTKPIEDYLGVLQGIADGLQATLKRAAIPPDEVTVVFGVNFSAESGVVLAKGSVGANLGITMVWRKAPAQDGTT